MRKISNGKIGFYVVTGLVGMIGVLLVVIVDYLTESRIWHFAAGVLYVCLIYLIIFIAWLIRGKDNDVIL